MTCLRKILLFFFFVFLAFAIFSFFLPHLVYAGCSYSNDALIGKCSLYKTFKGPRCLSFCLTNPEYDPREDKCYFTKSRNCTCYSVLEHWYCDIDPYAVKHKEWFASKLQDFLQQPMFYPEPPAPYPKNILN